MPDNEIPIYLTMNKIQIKKKRTHGKYLNFGEIPVKREVDGSDYDEQDLLDILNDIFNKKEYFEEHIQLSELKLNKKERILSGIIKFGEYGNSRDIYEAKSKKTKEKAKEGDVVADSFYFLFKLPVDNKLGCLVVEEKKMKSILGILSERIKYKLDNEKKYNHLIIHRKNKIPDEVSKNVTKNGIVTSIEYEMDKESIQPYDDNPFEIRNFKFTTNLVSDDKNTPEKFEEMKDKLEKGIKKIIDSFGKNKNDKTNLKVKYDDNRKTIVELHESIEVNIPRIKINRKLFRGDYEEGNPKFESIERIALEYVDSNFKKLWGSELEK